MSIGRAKPTLTRRECLAALGAAAGATALAAQAWAATDTPDTSTPKPDPIVIRKYSPRVNRIVERAVVIDMLSPLRLDLRPDAYAGKLRDEEIAMFRNSHVTALHNSIGVGGPTAYDDALTFLAGWNGFVARNPQVFTLVDTVDDIEKAKAAGKIAVIMGLQNAEQFRQTSDVPAFRQMGLRCAQLTYNTQNLLGSGSTERVDGGVTDYGAEIIREMNKVGMLVDVSHCGERTTLDAIELSAGPIAITHSNCRALNNHPRLKTDEAIRKLAAKGGVMGITGVRNFVKDREPTTVEDVINHIDHVVKLVGIDHVGIGTDSDLLGYDRLPVEQYRQIKSGYKASYAFREKIDTDGFNNPDKMYSLTDALLRRGYSEPNIEAVLGGNFRRLLATAWKPK
jgi:membrane dipeptidase